MDDRVTWEDIRKIRKKMKLSRSRFGELIGANGQTVYVWENQAEDSTKRIHPLFNNQLRRLKKKYLS